MGPRMLSGIVMLSAALPAAAEELLSTAPVMEEVVVTAKYPAPVDAALAELRAAIHDRLLDEAQPNRPKTVESGDDARSDETG